MSIADSEGMNCAKLSKEDCMTLYYHYRLHADTYRCNFANMYGYSFILLAQKEIADFINQVPYEFKINSRINLRLVKKFAPQLLDLPYYSHCRFYNYDSKRVMLVEMDKDRFKACVIRTLRRYTLGQKMIAHWRKHGSLEQAKIRRYCTERINNSIEFGKLQMRFEVNSMSYLPKYIEMLLAVKMLEGV